MASSDMYHPKRAGEHGRGVRRYSGAKCRDDYRKAAGALVRGRGVLGYPKVKP